MGKRKHQFHRENCESVIRDSFIDILNRTVVLTGKHAFEWSIIMKTDDCITKMTYSCRKTARKEYDKLKKETKKDDYTSFTL